MTVKAVAAGAHHLIAVARQRQRHRSGDTAGGVGADHLRRSGQGVGDRAPTIVGADWQGGRQRQQGEQNQESDSHGISTGAGLMNKA